MEDGQGTRPGHTGFFFFAIFESVGWSDFLFVEAKVARFRFLLCTLHIKLIERNRVQRLFVQKLEGEQRVFNFFYWKIGIVHEKIAVF